MPAKKVGSQFEFLYFYIFIFLFYVPVPLDGKRVKAVRAVLDNASAHIKIRVNTRFTQIDFTRCTIRSARLLRVARRISKRHF
jgi:hypothetical protein